jgi:cell division protein FtsW (lipid II flippase)
LPAINSVIDISSTRTMMSQFHPPTIIFVLLIAFSLAAALLAGHEMAEGSRSWVHIIRFSVAMAMTVYVILDVEYPRIGFIRIDKTDQILMDLRKGMN